MSSHVLPLPPRLRTSLTLLASLSKPSPSLQHQPNLFHSLQQAESSVLSLAADDGSIYTGSQDGQICVHTVLSSTHLRRALKETCLGMGQGDS